MPTKKIVSPKKKSPAPAPVHQTRKVIPSINDLPAEQNYDTRREFFEMMSRQIREEKDQSASTTSSPATSVKPVKNVGVYRRLARRFLVLIIILVLVVAYFSFSKLTVIVHPASESVKGDASLNIYGDQNKLLENETAIYGHLSDLEVSEVGEFSATGVSSEGATLTGKVTIINTTASSQPLVATTRLLSADNKLFRIKNAVTVPKNGQVEVDIYPDKLSADMAIAPTRFSIPGLNPALQAKIYGESHEAFTYNASGQKLITKEDLEAAKIAMNQKLIDKIKVQVASNMNGDDQVIYFADPKTLEFNLIDAKVGDAKDRWQLNAKNIVKVATFKSDDLSALIKKQLISELGADKILSDLDKNSFSYEIKNFNSTDKIVNLEVFYSSQVSDNQADFIDKKKLVNLNAQQLTNYLSNFQEVDTFELKFFPKFIKRAPSLSDRIFVETK